MIKYLNTLFSVLGNPITIYWDRGQHFKNAKMETWLRNESIRFFSSPSYNHKSIGMVKINNRLLENVIRKHAANKINKKN